MPNVLQVLCSDSTNFACRYRPYQEFNTVEINSANLQNANFIIIKDANFTVTTCKLFASHLLRRYPLVARNKVVTHVEKALRMVVLCLDRNSKLFLLPSYHFSALLNLPMINDLHLRFYNKYFLKETQSENQCYP